MAKERKNKYGVIETKNEFKIYGIVFGTKSQNFYKDEKNKREIRFGVNVNYNKPIYCSLRGFTKDFVYYNNGDTKNNQTIKVEWNKRHAQPKDGFNIIGVRIGVEQDAEGKNVTKNMTEYDATQYLYENLRDGDKVMIRGSVDYYQKSDGTVGKNYTISSIFKSNTIDFDADDFVEKAMFSRTLVYTDMEQETDENGKKTGRVIMNGYDISYQNVCKVNFVLTGKPLEKVNAIRKRLKSFNAVDVSGYMDVVTNITEVSVNKEDDWGEPNELTKKRANGPTTIEFVVDYINPLSIDEEKYSEDSISVAIRQINSDREARKNFGEKPKANIDISVDEDWGDGGFEDDSEPW